MQSAWLSPYGMVPLETLMKLLLLLVPLLETLMLSER
jgi:hypothetical protein